MQRTPPNKSAPTTRSQAAERSHSSSSTTSANEEFPPPTTPGEVACERLRKSKIRLNGLVSRKHLETSEIALAMLNVDHNFRTLANMEVPRDVAVRLETQVIFAMEKAFERLVTMDARLDSLEAIEARRSEFISQARRREVPTNPPTTGSNTSQATTAHTNQMNQTARPQGHTQDPQAPSQPHPAPNASEIRVENGEQGPNQNPTITITTPEQAQGLTEAASGTRDTRDNAPADSQVTNASPGIQNHATSHPQTAQGGGEETQANNQTPNTNGNNLPTSDLRSNPTTQPQPPSSRYYDFLRRRRTSDTNAGRGRGRSTSSNRGGRNPRQNDRNTQANARPGPRSNQTEAPNAGMAYRNTTSHGGPAPTQTTWSFSGWPGFSQAASTEGQGFGFPWPKAP